MLERAAEIIRNAEAFVITAGAGMGVDSGLPDFRGDQGFWKAYPMYARLGLSFADAANPQHFERDPAFGWGFYGHRTNLYRATIPHQGFHIIRRWIELNQAAYFVVTSNVDGQFGKAGFANDSILEVHGSIHHLQCIKPCTRDIWDNRERIVVDPATMRTSSLPRCPHCGTVSRPNILMFGDWSWLPDRTSGQEARFERFMEAQAGKPMAVIEMGAGTAIPTIRATSERLGWQHADTTVIRINPREPDIKPPHISLACGALEGLQKLDEALQHQGGRQNFGH
ncbi:Sir2 family NAD-dependent protein deacetylase [Geobacter sp. SVR]|uniref:SIR2 family NAD-dependent protein deacylase n=1 Tax=Geobacter sp. SVR TaxID=2495594 RepID=UPI00143EF905|nr:Sir2 family NAD-dependent protein deacetylase [Geobacter sp. SVR]BCS54738.1 NAD-dependent protein deacetylase [Geobacter sp. SVR]GCF86454.1 NAD-dependent protein deacetylase [Geobacter sp. SVR]